MALLTMLPSQNLDSFQSLHISDHTGDYTKDPQLRARAGEFWCRRLGKETSIARATIQIVHTQLSVIALSGATDQRLA